MPTEDRCSPSVQPYSAQDLGVIVAFLITGIGLILLLDCFGVSWTGDLWRYWPGAPIVIGIARLRERPRRVSEPSPDEREGAGLMDPLF